MSKYLDVSECTPGECEILHAPQTVEVTGFYAVRPKHTAATSYVAHGPDAELYAEAGTVAHETGKGPRQLADERDALLEALKDTLGFFQVYLVMNEMAQDELKKDCKAAISRAGDAITLAEGDGE